MTALQLLILSTIQRHGPQSDMSLWGNTRCESLTAVYLETSTLEEEGFIEHTPAHNRPQRFPMANDPVTYWQLTEKGRQIVAGKKEKQQEVCLGSK